MRYRYILGRGGCCCYYNRQERREEKNAARTRQGDILHYYIMTLQHRDNKRYNSMFVRLGTDYEIRNQCFFAILETMTTD